ncbi:hypothetical protein PT974_03398 [Cladobotryum mycophilum]|uniref:Uncharacterized protein n=1 Tax=Cladobotryum mycophilum TaxID=491253 RepID=A0ABR0SS72_9HYPO
MRAGDPKAQPGVNSTNEKTPGVHKSTGFHFKIRQPTDNVRIKLPVVLSFLTSALELDQLTFKTEDNMSLAMVGSSTASVLPVTDINVQIRLKLSPIAVLKQKGLEDAIKEFCHKASILRSNVDSTDWVHNTCIQLCEISVLASRVLLLKLTDFSKFDKLGKFSGSDWEIIDFVLRDDSADFWSGSLGVMMTFIDFSRKAFSETTLVFCVIPFIGILTGPPVATIMCSLLFAVTVLGCMVCAWGFHQLKKVVKRGFFLLQGVHTGISAGWSSTLTVESSLEVLRRRNGEGLSRLLSPDNDRQQEWEAIVGSCPQQQQNEQTLEQQNVFYRLLEGQLKLLRQQRTLFGNLKKTDS